MLWVSVFLIISFFNVRQPFVLPKRRWTAALIKERILLTQLMVTFFLNVPNLVVLSFVLLLSDIFSYFLYVEYFIRKTCLSSL